MDIYATIMNMSPWVLGIFALISVMIGWNYIKMGQTTQTKGIFKVIGVLLVVALMVNLGWLAMESTDEPGTTATPASWAVVASSSTDNTTVSGDTILTTYTLTSGAFGGAATGVVDISFACTRDDVSIADAVSRAYVVSVPTVTNTTSGISHDLVTKDSQGVYDADFTVDSVESAMSATFPGAPDDRTETVALEITFNANAIEALDQYEAITIQYNIGGTVFTHSIMHMD